MACHLGERRPSALDVLLDRVGPHLTMVAERIHRSGRDGVYRVATDQRLDIHRILVRRILHAGGGPEQPLRFGPGFRQNPPAWAGEQSLVAGVRDLRVGDPCLAPQPARRPRVIELVEPLVDRHVDPADEDARDAREFG